jgi:hypothetical protein
MRISWARCKRRLATLWFTGSGIIFLVILFQTFFGRFEDNVSEAWEWFLPTILPTLSLIISVFVVDTLGRGKKIRTVDKFMFRLTFSLSLLYLVVMSLTILMSPFSSLTPIELMKQSNLWLGPFQGLVSASLGAFFIGGE